MVSVGCCQTTSGVGGSFGISFVSGLSDAAPEWRRGVSSLKFRLQLGHSHLSCFEHFCVVLGFVFPVVYSGRRSFSCVCSKVTILCGMVSSTSGLTGWEDRSRSSVSLIICIVRIGFVWNFSVRKRVRLSTTVVIFLVFGTIRVISDSVFFPTTFQDATQSVRMCHSPNALDWMISSGGEAFWHRWIVRWSLEWQLRMRLSLFCGVLLEKQLISGLLECRPVVEICALP